MDDMEKRLLGTLKILDSMNESQSKEAGEVRGETIGKLYYHQSI
jgi:hypothetical protein